LGRESKEVPLEDLFAVMSELEFEGSVLELLQEMEREKLVERKDERVLLSELGLAKFNKTFAQMLSENPSYALMLVNLCRARGRR